VVRLHDLRLPGLTEKKNELLYERTSDSREYAGAFAKQSSVNEMGSGHNEPTRVTGECVISKQTHKGRRNEINHAEPWRRRPWGKNGWGIGGRAVLHQLSHPGKKKKTMEEGASWSLFGGHQWGREEASEFESLQGKSGISGWRKMFPDVFTG